MDTSNPVLFAQPISAYYGNEGRSFETDGRTHLGLAGVEIYQVSLSLFVN